MIPRTSRSPISPDICRLAQAIDVIGDRWTLLILRSALFGLRRFEDFHAELNAPRTVLSGRLKKLCDAEILTKKSYQQPGKRARSEYVLTDMGEALRPVLMMLMQWGDVWLDEGPAPLSFTKRSGGPIHAAFVDEGGVEVDPGSLRIVIRR